MDYHLAQINIGRLVAPVDDPQVAEFVAGLEPINALADRAPGFVWRLQSDSGNATDIAYNDDPFMIVNMSVWESIAALRNFTYRSDHVRFLRDRAKWFVKMDKPIYCLWWVPVGHHPSVREGREGWSTIRRMAPRRFRSGFRSSFRSRRTRAFAYRRRTGFRNEKRLAAIAASRLCFKLMILAAA
jgi:hypothetical protein